MPRTAMDFVIEPDVAMICPWFSLYVQCLMSKLKSLLIRVTDGLCCERQLSLSFFVCLSLSFSFSFSPSLKCYCDLSLCFSVMSVDQTSESQFDLMQEHLSFVTWNIDGPPHPKQYSCKQTQSDQIFIGTSAMNTFHIMWSQRPVHSNDHLWFFLWSNTLSYLNSNLFWPGGSEINLFARSQKISFAFLSPHACPWANIVFCKKWHCCESLGKLDDL